MEFVDIIRVKEVMFLNAQNPSFVAKYLNIWIQNMV